jgi:hypothetical protein
MRNETRFVLGLAVLLALCFAMSASAAVQVGNGNFGDPQEYGSTIPVPDWWYTTPSVTDPEIKVRLNWDLSDLQGFPGGQYPAPNGWVFDAWEGYDWSYVYSPTSLTLKVDNLADRTRIKDLWVWWVFTGNEGGVVDVTAPDGTPSQMSEQGKLQIAGTDQWVAWSHWQIKPQPSEESLTWLDCNVPTGKLWVGTYCAPGLPAIALVGVAPLFGLVLRRFRSK